MSIQAWNVEQCGNILSQARAQISFKDYEMLRTLMSRVSLRSCMRVWAWLYLHVPSLSLHYLDLCHRLGSGSGWTMTSLTFCLTAH